MIGSGYAIEATEVCKDYPVYRSLADVLRRPFGRSRRFRALDRVSFHVEYGQIAAVVGLNGAGKTTLLKTLCNLLVPTTGKVYITGRSLARQAEAARLQIGFVPSDERSFFWRISARANLEFFAALHHVPPRIAKKRIDFLLDCFGLAGKEGGHFRDYSSGMRKRLAIIRGLVHEPSILILDEPTNSLDVHWDRYLREYVRKWVGRQNGRAVVWSTHRMNEVVDMCHCALYLEKGRLTHIEDTTHVCHVMHDGEKKTVLCTNESASSCDKVF